MMHLQQGVAQRTLKLFTIGHYKRFTITTTDNNTYC